MRKSFSLVFGMIVLSWASAHAQIPVTDAGNLAVNSTTSIQSVITAIQTVLIEANQVLELIPAGVITADGLAEDMAMLGKIVVQAEGLSYDVTQLQAQIADLFNLEHPPNSTGMLRERVWDRE
jgi:conjugal transfer/entry exclusion protein